MVLVYENIANHYYVYKSNVEKKMFVKTDNQLAILS